MGAREARPPTPWWLLKARTHNYLGGVALNIWGGRARFLEKFRFFGIFDFLGPALVLGVLDIALLIPEVR